MSQTLSEPSIIADVPPVPKEHVRVTTGEGPLDFVDVPMVAKGYKRRKTGKGPLDYVDFIPPVPEGRERFKTGPNPGDYSDVEIGRGPTVGWSPMGKYVDDPNKVLFSQSGTSLRVE